MKELTKPKRDFWENHFLQTAWLFDGFNNAKFILVELVVTKNSICYSFFFLYCCQRNHLQVFTPHLRRFYSLISISKCTFLTEFSKQPSVSLKLKDDNIIGGIKDLDVDWVGYFSVDKYVVGFKYALDSILKKGLPESIFVKRAFNLASGKVIVLGDALLHEKSFSAFVKTISNAGSSLSVRFNSKDLLTDSEYVDTISDSFLGFKVKLTSTIEREDNKYKVGEKVSFARDDLGIEVKANDINILNGDPSVDLSISKKIDENNFIGPTVSIPSKKVKYTWLRTFPGGSLRSEYKLGDKLTLTWRDEAKSTGAWISKAEIPIGDDTKKTKISISRDFSF